MFIPSKLVFGYQLTTSLKMTTFNIFQAEKMLKIDIWLGLKFKTRKVSKNYVFKIFLLPGISWAIYLV